MICRFADLAIWRFADLRICGFADLSIFIETSPQPPSKGEPIHEQHTNDYEDYTNDLLIDKLTHWQIGKLTN